MKSIFVLVRALAYATLFISFVLVYLPASVLRASGIPAPEHMGIAQVAGILITTFGAALALSCVITFAVVGKGTPAPFDPPRRLVAKGPYAIVRNPMYVGAAIALAGAALFYHSVELLVFDAAFLLVAHLMVVFHEEPALRRTFGKDYDDYCHHVRRWAV